MEANKISIIIPTYNEAQNLKRICDSFSKFGNENLLEIIISDSPETNDNTTEIVENLAVKYTKSPKKGRATQMNHGASVAKGDILYFGLNIAIG